MADSSTLIDRVKIFAESSGSGPFLLGNAVPAFRGAEVLTDGLTYSYAVESGADYEAGQCVYVAGANQLIRSPTISSAGGAPVAFPANVAIIFTALAADLTSSLEGTGTVRKVSADGGTTGLGFTGSPIEVEGTLVLGGVLNVTNGGTGGTNAPEGRAALGLGNVDNTSDANKPISNATQTALDAKVATVDLAAATGTGLVGFVQIGSGSVPRDVTAKLNEIVTLADKAAPQDGSDATPAIDDALATSRSVGAGSGNYRAQGVTLSEDSQTFAANGPVNIRRNADGALISTSASDITLQGFMFYGNAPTNSGDILTFTGSRGRLLFCGADEAGSDNAVKITGTSWLVFGANDKYNGKFEITTNGIGGVSQYHNIIASRLAAGLTLDDTSFVTLFGNLITGNILVDKGAETEGGHGAKILATRVVGNVSILQSSSVLGSGAAVSLDVTIGDGVDSFDGITVDPSFIQNGGRAFTIAAGVKGTFHVANLLAVGVTITIPESVRQVSNVYHGELTYTSTISGGGGSFSLGDGSLTGRYSQQGNIINGYVELVIGSTTTLPTSGLFATVPVATGGRPILCQIEISDSGGGSYQAAGRIFSDGLRIIGWRQADAGADALVTDIAPITLGSGDAVRWTFSYALGGK